jgi:hypothetical protein
LITVDVGQRGGHRLTRDRSIASGPMTTVNLPIHSTASVLPVFARHPQRISVTLNWQVHQQLIERSGMEGRSLSNLVAYLLEASCKG